MGFGHELLSKIIRSQACLPAGRLTLILLSTLDPVSENLGFSSDFRIPPLKRDQRKNTSLSWYFFFGSGECGIRTHGPFNRTPR